MSESWRERRNLKFICWSPNTGVLAAFTLSGGSWRGFMHWDFSCLLCQPLEDASSSAPCFSPPHCLVTACIKFSGAWRTLSDISLCSLHSPLYECVLFLQERGHCAQVIHLQKNSLALLILRSAVSRQLFLSREKGNTNAITLKKIFFFQSYVSRFPFVGT